MTGDKNLAAKFVTAHLMVVWSEFQEMKGNKSVDVYRR